MVFWRLLGSVLVGFWIVNAFQMLACDAVSFAGSGGRVVRWSCVQNGIPGPLIGVAIIAAGFTLLWIWWGRFLRKANKRSSAQMPVLAFASGSRTPDDDSSHLADPFSRSLEAKARSGRGTARFDAASDSNASEEVLSTLARDPWARVRRAVAENVATPMSVLAGLREDQDSEVALAAALSMERRLDHGDDPEPPPQEALASLPLEQAIETRDSAGRHELSGAVTSPESPDLQSPSDARSLLDDLERLAALVEAGHLTDDEFASMKRRLLKNER